MSSPFVPRVLRKARTEYNKFTLPLMLKRLKALNETASARVTGDVDAIVSLTSHGSRISTVHLTIESIARGTHRPRRLVLWLDEVDAVENPTAELQRLIDRGLEVRLSDNLGPHTKYFPSLALRDPDSLQPLVTADDDIIYPRWWLHKLVASARDNPEGVHCYRAWEISVTEDGGIGPYRTWSRVYYTESSPRVFPTGVSGVIYPPAMLNELTRRGTEFLECSPRADDIWLHYVAISSGIQARQITRVPIHFPIVPETQDSGLMNENVALSRNDEQITRTYNDAATRKLTPHRGPTFRPTGDLST